jgi:histone deacetylase complex regulatory component SIN3
MRILNVVVVKDNNVQEMESFVVEEEQLSYDVIEAAEKHFIKKLEEFCDVQSNEEETIETAIENGYYQSNDVAVNLVWS